MDTLKQKKVFILLGITIVLIGAFWVFGQKSIEYKNINLMDSTDENNDAEEQLPQFSDFHVDKYQGEIAEVDFSTEPDAALFKTRIEEAVEGGVNFAGHYIVATWGCGTNCQSSAIVDVKTGNIVEYGIPSSFELSHKADSRLLIKNPPDNIPSTEIAESLNIKTEYYIIEESGSLGLIYEGGGLNDPNDMQTLPEPPGPGEQDEQYDYNNPPRGEYDNDPNALKEK